MRKKWWWLGGAVVVVVIVGLLAGPWLYGTLIAEDDAPAASVSTSGAQAATGGIDGQWVVGPGDSTNKTSAGYTVAEVLNGADVTVVGSTTEVSGTATVADEKLNAGRIEVRTGSITTDNSRRDNQFRGNIFDVTTYPTATFQLDAPVDLSAVPSNGTTQTVSAQGTLTLKDRSRPVSVDMEVLRSGDALIVSGKIPTTWRDYGVEPPSLGFVTVADTGTVDFLVNLEK